MPNHQIVKCSDCSTIIRQCRCIWRDKTGKVLKKPVTFELCKSCKESQND